MQSVVLPERLSLQEVLRFAKELDATPSATAYRFDCSGVQHVPPFGMLFTGACLRQFRKNRGSAGSPPTCTAYGVHANRFAAHMGFWQSFGLPVGNEPGEAAGSDRYIPITCKGLVDFGLGAKAAQSQVGWAVEHEANRLAEVLTQDSADQIENTLSYSFRELFRNTFEHSKAEQVWYCAQYWPSKDLVEIAILDEGIGIPDSFAGVAEFEGINPHQVVLRSTDLGVTSARRLVSHSIWGDSGSDWDNSGYGLYVIREVCKHAGSMVLVSGGIVLCIAADRIQTFDDTTFRGTAVRVLLKPSKLESILGEVLARVGDDKPGSRITPSMLARITPRRGGVGP